MKFSINTVSNIKKAKDNNSVHVFLDGDDGSSHNFTISLDGKDPDKLTLKDIENMAIDHARASFTNCKR